MKNPLVTEELQNAWSKAVMQTLDTKYGMFYISLLGNLRVMVVDFINAPMATDGLHLFVNPNMWLRYSPSMRCTILVHELWHVAGEHSVRGHNKDPEDFNSACDYCVNDMLAQEGYKMSCGLLDKKYSNMSPEQIYELIQSNKINPPQPQPLMTMQGDSGKSGSGQPNQQPCAGEDSDSDGSGSPQSNDGSDLSTKELEGGRQALQSGNDVMSPQQTQQALQALKDKGIDVTDCYGESVEPHKALGDMKATQQAMDENLLDAYNQAEIHADSKTDVYGNLPGDIQLIIDSLKESNIPWTILTKRYYLEAARNQYSYTRPRKAYMPQFILPSLRGMDLTSLGFAFDTSGSVSDNQVMLFNSETAFVQNRLRPKTLHIVTFDTQVRDKISLTKRDRLGPLKVTGRGGTNLHPVFKYFSEMPRSKRPKVLFVFTDLYCAPITEKPPFDVVWFCFDNPNAKVNFGKLIHVRTNDYS